MSRDNTMGLRRLELKVKELFNWKISKSWELLVEVTYELNKEGSYEINEQEDERESIFDQKIDFWS